MEHVGTRRFLQAFHSALFLLCSSTEMEQPGCSQGSGVGQEMQHEAQLPILQEARLYVDQLSASLWAETQVSAHNHFLWFLF